MSNQREDPQSDISIKSNLFLQTPRNKELYTTFNKELKRKIQHCVENMDLNSDRFFFSIGTFDKLIIDNISLCM